MTVDRHTLRSGGCLKRFLAVTAAMALAGSGIVATSVVAQADPEPPATLMSSGLNPMGAATPTGSKDGYTVFVKDNAHFANAETEGSIAVGGVATFDKNAGIYPLVHQAAGNEDYSLPTLDGAPNRLLLQEFGAYSNSEVKLEERNSPHEGIVGSAKIFHQSAPEDFSVQEKSNSPTFAETGTVQGVPQVWASGYPYSETAMDVAGTFTSKFPGEDPGNILTSYGDYATPEVQDTTNNGINLVELLPGPNKVDISAFTGSQGKFNVTGASADNFLVIKATQQDVKKGVLHVPSLEKEGKDGDGATQASGVLFDLSEVAGDVELKPKSNMLRGSFYAPNAKLIYNEGNLEGQVVAKSFEATSSANEIHTNLFMGRFPQGTFNLRKVVEGVDAEDAALLEGVTFPVTATWEGGEETFNLPADGTVVNSGVTLPAGTIVSFKEGTIPTLAGYTFTEATLSADKITILNGDNADIAWTVTNTYEKNAEEEGAEVGGFDLTKALKGVNAKDFPKDTVFTVKARWTIDGKETVKEYELPADGTVVNGPQDLPVGTKVTFNEVKVPNLDGYSFTGVEFSPKTVTVKAGETVHVSATNTYKKGEGGMAVTGANESQRESASCCCSRAERPTWSVAGAPSSNALPRWQFPDRGWQRGGCRAPLH